MSHHDQSQHHYALRSADHHVQFTCDPSEGDQFGGDNEIIVDGYQSDHSGSKLDVHLGFLQINHRYEVTVHIPKNVIPSQLRSKVEPAENIKSTHCRLISADEDEVSGGVVLKVEYFAHKEKLLKEETMLQVADKTLRLVFHARVLGRGKGTPMLKNGVRCIGVVEDEESEASDWQGFS